MQASLVIQPEGQIGAHSASLPDPSGEEAARGEGAAFPDAFSDEQLLLPGLPLLAADAESDQAAARGELCKASLCSWGSLKNTHVLGGAGGLEGA